MICNYNLNQGGFNVNISSLSNNVVVATSSNSDASYLLKQESSIEQKIQQENLSKDDT